MRRALVTAGILVVGLAALAGAAEVAERIAEATPRARAEAHAEDLRDRVREVRPRLDACLEALDRTETAFRAQERTTRTLRARVDAFEEMHDDGVPADRYDEYIETFEHYNESLPGWEALADTVQETSARCRRIAARHNVLADSLRDLLLEAELVEEGWIPPAGAEQGGDPADFPDLPTDADRPPDALLPDPEGGGDLENGTRRTSGGGGGTAAASRSALLPGEAPIQPEARRMAARFEVHQGVNLRDRYLFGLVGVIEEGMVHTGMEASLESEDLRTELLGKVHGVEFIEQDGITEPALTFHYRNPDKIRRWEAIDWKGKKLRLEWTQE